LIPNDCCQTAIASAQILSQDCKEEGGIMSPAQGK
jgi:hypothetical protein